MERHVVLVHPQIPWNTGAIGRTCLGGDATLHLIKPLGFSLDMHQVKRAGLDYWPEVSLKVWDSVEELIESCKVDTEEIFLLTRFAKTSFRDISWTQRAFLFFGSEVSGLESTFKNQYPNRQFTIPTSDKIRSLNLATSVGIVLFASNAPLTS